MERQNKYAHLFKRLSKSEIADMAVCALDTLPEEQQLEIFSKFFKHIDDRKVRRRFLIRIIGFIEGQKKMARADRWMETHMRNNPQEKPKIVAGRYVFIARIDNVKKDVYVALAQKIKNRLAKRRERNGA